MMFVKVTPRTQETISGSREAPEGSFLLSPQDHCGGLDPFIKSEQLLSQPGSCQGGTSHQGCLHTSSSQRDSLSPVSAHPAPVLGLRLS